MEKFESSIALYQIRSVLIKFLDHEFWLKFCVIFEKCEEHVSVIFPY